MTGALLLTISQAAAELHVGKATLYRQMIQPGRIRTVRIGNAVRVPRSELERWLSDELDTVDATSVIDTRPIFPAAMKAKRPSAVTAEASQEQPANVDSPRAA